MSNEASVRTVDRLRAAVHPDPERLASAAASEAAGYLRAAVEARGVAHAMFATGNSQLQFIDALVAGDHAAPHPEVPWSSVVVYHMDEYVGVGSDHGAGFQRWIRERIVDRTHPAAAHYIDGRADPDDECRRYSDLLAAHPLDLCCLGIGENGHLAFNDPPVADFDDPLDVKVVELDVACRRQQVGEGHFPSVEAVPTHALTVTIPALLRARAVVAVVPEGRKAQAVHDALTGPISTACPASVLRRHAQVSLHLDRDSAALL